MARRLDDTTWKAYNYAARQPGRHGGTAFLDAVCAEADREQVTIIATAAARDLVDKVYAEAGFTHTGGRQRPRIQRPPRQP